MSDTPITDDAALSMTISYGSSERLLNLCRRLELDRRRLAEALSAMNRERGMACDCGIDDEIWERARELLREMEATT